MDDRKYVRENYKDIKVLEKPIPSDQKSATGMYKLVQSGEVYEVMSCAVWNNRDWGCHDGYVIIESAKINDIYLNAANELVIVLPLGAEYEIGYWYKNSKLNIEFQ